MAAKIFKRISSGRSVFRVPLAVSPIREDTRAVLRFLDKRKPGSLLELGCGSGYLAIQCALRGWRVTATEVDTTALSMARENAARLGAKVTFEKSDLFSGIRGSFDVVVFNPPLVFSSSRAYPYLRGVVARIPPVNALLEAVIGARPNPARRKMVSSFLSETPGFLRPKGIACVVLLGDELSWLPVAPTEVLVAGGRSVLAIIREDQLR